MSDRPTNPSESSADAPQEGGWHTPQTPGDWRRPAPAVEDEGGWRAPQRLASVGEQEGWRVLKPSSADTETETEAAVLPPDDSSVPEPQEEMTPADAVEQTVLPYDDEPMPLEQPAADSTAAPPAPSDEVEVLPFASDEPQETETLADQIEDITDQAGDESLERLDEDEDEDSFSMSELVALASLVDEPPPSRLQPAAPAPTESASEDDPAEIARRKVAELMQQGDAPPSTVGETAVEDSAEVARRMAQQLAASQPMSSEIGAPAAPALSKADQELLDKYVRAEDAIRTVRARFRAGQLTREQMQAELRQHMVLDEDQVWWMMGVETDSWYRFENGQWVVATPRVIAESKAGGSRDVAGARLQDASAGSLPYLPDEPPMPAAEATTFDDDMTVRTSTVSPEYESMPLPRAVPIRDPEATVPGMPGVYLDPYGGSEPTVANAAVDPNTVVASPVGEIGVAEVPPDYDVDVASPIYEKARARQQQGTMRSLLIIAGIAFAGLFALMACGIIAGVLYYRSLAAPWEDEVAALANYQPQFRTARILAADGSVIAELTSQQGGARDTIPLSEISPYLIHAVVSTENERFYSDPGWDAIAIGRAFLQNVFSGDIESGASTLTQQIARSLILQDTSVSAERKLQEIVIASLIAQQYDKNFILELYLNEYFFGNQSYGVEAASQFYFGHSAADLNIAESAMLAGLLQAPATYDPVVNREASFGRMDVVLNLMADAGCLQFQHAPYLNQPFCVTRGGGGPSDITSGEVTLEKAVIETTNYQPRQFQVRYPHFVNYVQQLVEEAYGTDAMYRGGFEIRTTLVPRIQDVAQSALQTQVQQLLSNGVNTGSVVVTDPRNGAILAMVGSPDFNNTQFQGQNNFAFLPQQPGSSIKPITYAAALEGFTDSSGARVYDTPATIIWDVPTTYNTTPPYSPVNFDRQFHGPVAVRYALQNSYNVPAVKTYALIGADRFRDMATRLGLTFLPEAQFGLPTALGADEVRLIDMVEAYGTFANDGVRVPLSTITQITDFQGSQVALPNPGESTQAISPSLAYIMQNILSDNQARAAAFGLNSGLILPGYSDGVIGAKTGTSNDNRDLWTMGFTNNTVVGVWVGRAADNNPTTGTTQTSAVPIWNAVMRVALEGRTPEAFTNPGGVVQMQVCGDTGTLFDPAVNPNCTNLRAELFLENQPPPPANTSFVQTMAVDTWSGQRATTACPEYVETRTFANIDDPFAVQWLNSPQGQAIAQQLGLPVPLEPVPQGECPANQQPNVRLTAPSDGQEISGTVNITGIVSAVDLNRFQLELAPIGQDNFAIISPVFTTQQPSNATLMQWNTSTVPNGIYRLRLSAFANNGGFIYKTIQIGVNNVITPTDIPLPTAVLPPPSDATAIPFDAQVVPAEQATTAPPTAIPFGGLAPLATPTPFGN